MTLGITETLELGRYRARLADGPRDLAAALDLRRAVFRAGGRPDGDAFDAPCRHVLVETGDGALCGTCRVLVLPSGQWIDDSYAAQFYDLGKLRDLPAPLAEIGRFCVAPTARDADVLRVAWAALTRLLEAEGVEFLFGCASFPGTDPAPFGAAFAHLLAHHVAPEGRRPGIRAPETRTLAEIASGDPRQGRAALPRLLRTYLGMGGWVSDHAVIDRDLGTLHVFTGVEAARIPPARLRALRALAAGLPG